MIKKLINFLERHRIIFALIVIILVSLIYIIVNVVMFFKHDFEAFKCSKNNGEEICIYNNKEIYADPKSSIDKIFKEYEREILELKKEYKLPEFNFYTAYYYELASNFDYQMNKRNETLNKYFKIYSNSYDLEKFYKKNNLFFRIFYPYKII